MSASACRIGRTVSAPASSVALKVSWPVRTTVYIAVVTAPGTTRTTTSTASRMPVRSRSQTASIGPSTENIPLLMLRATRSFFRPGTTDAAK
jgi:hypothetical protein